MNLHYLRILRLEHFSKWHSDSGEKAFAQAEGCGYRFIPTGSRRLQPAIHFSISQSALVLAAVLVMLLALWASAGDSACFVSPKGTSFDQEPPPSRGLLQRVAQSVHTAMRPHREDPAREEVHAALESLGVTGWHRAGHRGRGIRVAVLDSGFKGYRQAIGKVLTITTKVKSFRLDGQLDARDSQHGILCAEVIHHIAPEAELLLTNWEPETPSAFLQAVRWAVTEGAHILSCSIIMPAWSDGEGGGDIHRQLRQILGDRLLFASAGNTAQRHWAGMLQSDPQGYHHWVKGKRDNLIRPFSNDRVSVELCSAAGQLELLVVETSTGREVGRARTQAQDGCCNAVVRFDPDPNRGYAIRLRNLARHQSLAGSFHLTCLGGKLQYTTLRGSIPFPGDGDEVIAVGAVDSRGRRLPYSSCGPLTSGLKPDLTACVPFPSVWRPDQPFSGTSAAAPQAAGIAAILWARHPNWSSQRVRQELIRTAHKVRPEHCIETGHGLVQLPR